MCGKVRAKKKKMVHRVRDTEKEKERIRQTRKMAHKKERERLKGRENVFYM